MRRLFTYLSIFLVLLNAMAAWAEEGYEFTANDKFTRSVVNIATFYLEAPIVVYETSVNENPIAGILYGLPVGVAKSALRLAVGAIELGTFPFEPYAPLMEPEFLLFERKE